MATHPYKRCFKRGSAPYMGVCPEPFDDVLKIRRNASHVTLTDDCDNIEQLSRLTRLKRLGCELKKEWLPYLSAIPTLEWIDFELPGEEKLPSLESLSQIRTLVLQCNRHQTHLRFLRGLDSLRSLCVSEATGVTDLGPIGRLSGLQELYIDGSMRGRSTVRTYHAIGKLTDLRYLVLLVGSDQASRPLKHLLKLERLEEAHLDASVWGWDDLDAMLEVAPKLKEIEFNGGVTWKAGDAG